MKLRVLIGVLVLACIVTMGMVSCFSAPADDGGGVTIHYFRPDQKYDNWDMWIWAADPGEEMGAFKFGAQPDEEGWMTCEIPMPSYVLEYGFIVRRGVPGNEWEEKDIVDDRFAKAKEIWLVSGDEKAYTTKPNVSKD